jgi:electron transfer flavoprotein alpha/beta subunit
LGLDPATVGSAGAKTKVMNVQDPHKKEGVKIFSGTPEESASQLVNELIERKLI